MPLKTSADEQPTLNLTPMIDIVFLLIIFFMVGTKFTELSEAEKNIPLHVPTVSAATALTDAPRKSVINLFNDGTITFNNKTVPIEELAKKLQQSRTQYSKAGVVVRGDATVNMQSLTNVLTACRDAGISDMGISVKPLRR